MRWISKLSLFFLVLTIPPFIPSISKTLLCPVFADSRYVRAREFGSDGYDGVDGRKGRSGRNGENRTLFVNDSPIRVDISGGDGEAGEDGREGQDARCYNQPRDVEYDLVAPDGGDGGNGGDGGDGGNGGILTLYYTNPNDLRNVFVNAEGGEGGRPGRGAYGGDGCRCRYPRWEEKTCTGDPDSPEYECYTERFYCEDGEDGRDGRSGREGREGSSGRLVLIQQGETLQSDSPSTTLAIATLADQSTILSRNVWRTRRGATSLLASGSVISDSYREFVERLEVPVQLVWMANRPMTEFANERVTINLGDDRNVRFSFSNNAWIEGETVQEGETTQFIVSDAILESEVKQLTRGGISGQGSNLSINLVDFGRLSDQVSTRFRVKYRSRGGTLRFRQGYDYKTRYEGEIPPELVSYDNNQFTIQLGRLPIDPDYLRSGIGIDLEVVAIRSFGGNSTEQRISWRGEIE
ncbi:MAG: collagen-like protein [Chroococcales cyanobacterium]